MSRIGNSPITIPSGVTIEKNGYTVLVTGPKGVLNMEVDPLIVVEVQADKIIVKRKNDLKKSKSLHGLTRNLIFNMIVGTTEGWSKNLELVGVGFKAETSGSKLTMNIGYSHPVVVEAFEGITFAVSDNTKIKVSGIDKQKVGQMSANIKKMRVPDAYKGKGIRFQGEYIKKKAGKSAKVGATGAAGAK